MHRAHIEKSQRQIIHLENLSGSATPYQAAKAADKPSLRNFAILYVSPNDP
jgi:hypothetical protein